MSKKLRQRMKKAIVVATVIPMFISPLLVVPNVSHAASNQVPELTAYQSGNSVKLEWSVDMLDSDVLFSSSFEDGQFIPSFPWSWRDASGQIITSNGNQVIVSEDAQEGSKAYRVNNTLTEGNYSGSSIMNLGRKYAPNGSPISITFYAKTDSSGTISPIGDGGWATTLNNFTGVNVAETAPAGQNAIKLTSTTGINVGTYVSFDTDPNNIQYLYDVKSVDRTTNTITFWSNLPRTLQVGEQLKTRPWRGAWSFSQRSISASDGWKRFSINTNVTNFSDYDVSVRGGSLMFISKTGGKMYLDNIRFGYASQAAVYRSGQELYRGYLSDFLDTNAKDVAKPNAVSNVGVVTFTNNKPSIGWNASADNGTPYSYTIKGVGVNGETAMSAVKNVTVNTGVKGYSVVVDQNPTTIPDATIETTTTSFQSPSAVTGNFYVHVAAVDNAGNVSDPVHIPYNDTIAPTITRTSNLPAVTNQDITIQVQASDIETGVKRIQLPNGSWVTGTTASYTVSQNGSYKFVAEDNAGNQKELIVPITQIDKVAPASPIIRLNNNQMTNQNVEVSITYPDDAISKEYRISSRNLLPSLRDSSWVKHQNVVISGDYSMTLNGTANSQATYVNIPANSSTSYTASIGSTSSIVRIWEYKGNVYNNQSHTLDSAHLIKTFTPKADTTILRYELINDKIGTFTYENMQLQEGDQFTGFEPLVQGAWKAYDMPISLQENAVVEARSIDSAGNQSGLSRLTVNNVDKTIPTAPSVTFDGNRFMVVGGTDEQSGVYQTLVSINGGEWIPYTESVKLPDGNYTLKIKTVDVAGNESPVTTVEKLLYADGLQLAKEATDKANGDFSQLSVDEAKSLVQSLPDSAPEKKTLLDQLIQTQGQIDLDKITAEFKVLSDRVAQGGISLVELDEIQDRLGELSQELNQLPNGIDTSSVSSNITNLNNQTQLAETILKLTSSSNPQEIEDLGDLISQLPDGALKDELTQRLVQTEKTQEAIKKVEGVEGNPTSDTIKNAKDAVNQLADSPEKEALLNRIQQAENVMHANSLTEAVEVSLDADDFAKAEEMVSKIEDPIVRQTYQNKLDQIKPYVEAISLVEKAETQKTQADVNAARLKVNSLTDETVKAELYKRLYRYDKELQSAESKVRSAEIYMSSLTIQSAGEAVNVLVESPQKVSLQERLKALGVKIDEKALQDLISKAETKVKQAETYKRNPYLSDALTAVNGLPDGETKSSMLARLNVVLGTLSDQERSSAELLAKINSVADEVARKTLLDVYRYVDIAERYNSRSNIVTALDKVSGIPEWVKSSEPEIVESLADRVNRLKGDYNTGIEQQVDTQAVSKATSYVEMYEKYKTSYYQKRAQESVVALPEGEAKNSLQARIDAVGIQ